MFRCDACGKQSQPGEKMIRVVTETRPKTYTRTRTRRDGSEYEEEVGYGEEIVSEAKVHAACAPQTEEDALIVAWAGSADGKLFLEAME